MMSTELHEILTEIDIVDFLEYTGTKVRQTTSGLRGICPFHQKDQRKTLIVNTDLKTIQCPVCGFQGHIPDFVRRKYNCRNGQVLDFLKKYKTKRIDGYEIVSLTKHEIVLRIAKRKYQLTRFKLFRLNDFAMVIKLTDEHGQDCIADVNLTRLKSRHDYTEEVKNTLFISEEIIRNDLSIIMKAVEKLQREQINQREAEQSSLKVVYRMTKSEEKAALGFLENKDIFTELFKDTERLGYVGDELGKKILYLAGTSRLLAKPISVLSVANSAAGKSFAQQSILSLFPDDEVMMHTRISPKSISHFSRNELCNKILAVDELTGIEEEAMSQLRSLLSQGKISTAYTHVDRLSGRMETMKKQVLGPVALITSTTNEEMIDEESRNRFLVLAVDESSRQTSRVLRSMIYQNTKKGISAQKERQKIERKYKAIQKCLRPQHIVIPDTLARHLTFNDKRVIYKRKFGGYLSIVYTLALHRQFQRKRHLEFSNAGAPYETIAVEKRDIVDANDIVLELFGNLLGDLNPVNSQCLNHIITFCRYQAKETQLEYHDVAFSRRDIRKISGWDRLPLRRAFETLLDMEYIYKVYGRERSRHYYKLNVDDAEETVKLNVWRPKN